MSHTPLHLEIVLHYHSRAHDMENLTAPAVKEYIRQLLEDGVLMWADKDSPRNVSYTLTDKGRAFLDALLNTPFPVKVERWEMP